RPARGVGPASRPIRTEGSTSPAPTRMTWSGPDDRRQDQPPGRARGEARGAREALRAAQALGGPGSRLRGLRAAAPGRGDGAVLRGDALDRRRELPRLGRAAHAP